MAEPLPKIKGYPRKDEPPLEDEPKDESEDNRDIQGRTPNLAEQEDDPDEF